MVTNWISALSGCGQLDSSDLRMSSCKVGHHDFPSLPDYVTAPEMDHHYIAVMLSGPVRVEAVLSGRNMSAQVSMGQIFLMAAGEKNTWKWDRPTKEAHVFIDPAIVDQISRECGLGAVEVMSRFAVNDEAAGSTIQILRRSLNYTEPGAKLMLECGIEFLVHQIISNHCAVLKSKEIKYKLSRKQLLRLGTYADENLASNPDLAELASQVNMSRFHFSRVFKNTVGRSPHAWLMEKRMRRAKEMIEETSLPILTIAGNVGFQSQSHFGQMFKKWSGISPVALRHQRRN